MSAGEITSIYLPWLGLIGGLVTVATYGTKIARSVYTKWIAWDDARTDLRIQAKFGDYDKESLDKTIADLCNSITESSKEQDYHKMKEDISKLKGAVSMVSGGKFDIGE